MNVYEMVFAIVLVTTIGAVAKSHVKRRQQRQDDDPPTDGPGRMKSSERLKLLEERVQVLERIVTDQGYELRQKFRDLE